VTADAKFEGRLDMSDSPLLEARKAARADKLQQDADLRILHERALTLVSDRSRAPAVLARAYAAVAKWESARTCSPFYIEEWRRILADPVDELRKRVLHPDAPDSIALMHNTPLASCCGNRQ
jgi:hypothetical protein